MATVEEIQQAYESQTQGGVRMRQLWSPQDLLYRPDAKEAMEAFIEQNPEAFQQAYAQPAVGAYYTEGGVQYTAGGQVLAEQMPQAAPELQQITQEGLTTYYMETPTGRVSISPEEYGKIAKEHIMGSRMNVFASVPPKTERQLQIEERRRDPWFQRVFFTEKAITGQATTAIIEWAFAKDKEKFAKTQAAQWRVEQTQIMTKLGEGKRMEVTFERTAPVAIAATMILVSPVLGKAMGPTLTAGIGGGLVGIGTYFAASGWKPVVEYSQPSTLGAGIVMMGAGSLMVKSGWEAAFPKPPPDVKVEVLQRGGAMQRIEPSRDEFTGIKKSEMFGTAKDRKFIAESFSDYGAKIGKKEVTGFGQVTTHVKEIKQPSIWKAMKARITGEKPPVQFGETISSKQFFSTIGVDIGDDMIFSQTIHIGTTGDVHGIYMRTAPAKDLAKAGIDLTLKEAGKGVKAFGTTTKITEWYKGMPSKTVSYMKGEKLLGADITDIGHIQLTPSLSSTTTGGGGLKTSKKLFTGIAEVTSGVGKSATKDIIKSMVVSPPKLARTYAFAISKPSVKTDTRMLVKTDMMTGLKTRTKTGTRIDSRTALKQDTSLSTRMDTRTIFGTGLGQYMGSVSATRLDSQLGQKLDTGLALRMDTQHISMPSTIPPITPLTEFPAGIGPILGGIGFGPSDFFRRKKTKIKRLKKTTRPQPSLGGIVLRKKGKLKKMFTGIEPVRPLGKGKRKRWL